MSKRTGPERRRRARQQLEALVDASDWPAVGDAVATMMVDYPNAGWWFEAGLTARTANDQTTNVEPYCREVLARSPQHQRATRRLLLELLRRGHIAEATTLALKARDDHPQHAGILALSARALHEAGMLSEARHLTDCAIDCNPAGGAAYARRVQIEADARSWPGVCATASAAERADVDAMSGVWLHLVNAAVALGESAMARQLLSPAPAPNAPIEKTEALIILEELLGRYEAALEIVLGIEAQDPVRWGLRQVRILGSLGRLAEAESHLDGLEGADRVDVLTARATLATLARRVDEAADYWGEIAATGVDMSRRWRMQFRALGAASRFELATAVLDDQYGEAEVTNRQRIDRALLNRMKMRWGPARDLIAETLDDPQLSAEDRKAALTIGAHLAYSAQDDRGFLHAMARHHEAEAHLDPPARCDLAQIYIAMGSVDSAIEVVAGIPAEYATYWVQVLRSWVATQRGDHELAKAEFELALRRSANASVTIDEANLESMPSRLKITDGDVVVFSTCRDERTRLPDFLRYYRELGCDGFVIVDNGSTDGTLEYLLEQSDVQVHLTQADYVASGVGMQWVNRLIADLATTNWCIYADADELLVYPGCEDRRIHAFVAELDSCGFEAAGGFMLDMHAETLTATMSFQSGDSMVEAAPFFTNTYDFQPSPVSPYINVRGGFRDTCLSTKYLQMTKTPLIRSDSNIRFLVSSHETTPGRVAPVACAFLHFKFLGDALSRHRKEAEWTSFSYWGNNLAALEEAMSSGDVRSNARDTVAYRDSAQLLELGLLRDLVPVTSDPSEQPRICAGSAQAETAPGSNRGSAPEARRTKQRRTKQPHGATADLRRKRAG